MLSFCYNQLFTKTKLLIFPCLRKNAKISETLRGPGRPRRRNTSVLVSESKGNRLREKVDTISSIERSIVWLCRSGLTTREDINWLKTRLSALQSDHGELCIFIFLGTCDSTTKQGIS